jgi:hypothetical protein
VGFKAGEYARTVDGIVLILNFGVGSFRTVRTDGEEERVYLASDLTPWSPQNDERVVEANNEDSPIGIVVDGGEDISLVVWKNLRSQVSFVNSRLEPVWSD